MSLGFNSSQRLIPEAMQARSGRNVLAMDTRGDAGGAQAEHFIRSWNAIILQLHTLPPGYSKLSQPVHQYRSKDVTGAIAADTPKSHTCYRAVTQ
ncbi:hypothetical protein PCANC_07174 [Puccinia coronata f. sp. avenae]|uniref:Uncharacterized protein n=1 Tax=Puccinia coronata f. sp. avenae TaxID=200324 RepID=A0A2N5SXQ9_9BASI|nr:hypothetical protein PCANC_07174 [Puccinia coronata f. sp. avenae]